MQSGLFSKRGARTAEMMSGMTGIETTGAIIKATGKGVTKAFSVSEAEKQAITELQQEHGLLYQAASVKAQRSAVRERVLLNLWRPIAFLARVSSDYFSDEFAADLAHRTAHIPDDHLTPPRPAVVMPAMEGLGWSIDEPELREMYLNLIAKAVDDRAVADCHPAFAEVLRQLQPEEAVALVELATSETGVVPMVHLRAWTPDGDRFSTGASHLLDDTPFALNSAGEDVVGLWIYNWLRLGLVEDAQSSMMPGDDDPDPYAFWTEHSETVDMRQRFPDREVVPVKTALQVTHFGWRFGRAVSASTEPGPDLDEHEGVASP